jgi:hypothetical protein
MKRNQLKEIEISWYDRNSQWLINMSEKLRIIEHAFHNIIASELGHLHGGLI